ncbi:MAG TPA: carboxypeptidase regulatory-like domain-containing protein [Polyangiaceae bacterium]
MRQRLLLGAGVLLVLLRCGGDGSSEGNGGSSGNAGDGSSGSSGSSGRATGGSGGAMNGAGEGGDAQSGSSGSTSGRAGRGGGGNAGTGTSGTGGDGVGDDTVSGHVTAGSGEPVVGAVVAIGSTLATTDADGYFEIPNVAPKYDAVLVQEDQGYALVVRSATTRTLNLVGQGFTTPHSVTVLGAITGGAGAPLPSGHVAAISFLSSDMKNDTSGGGVNEDGTYGLVATWFGESTVEGDLFALGLERDADAHPVSYDGFGAKHIKLRTGVEFIGPDASTTIALQAIDARTVSGTLSAPDGYDAQLSFRVGRFETDYIENPPGDFETLLPVGAGELPTYVHVELMRELGNTLEDVVTFFQIDESATELELSSSTAAIQVLPLDAVEGVDGDTTFTWTNPPHSVATVQFEFDAWSVDVVTTDTSTKLPDLADYGVTFGAGETGRWEVWSALGVDGVDDVDAWTQAQEFSFSYPYLVAHDRSGYASSGFRTFTLAE